MEAAREVDRWFGEEAAEYLDLFFLSRATRLEVLAERLVLDVVPAGPDTEAETAAGRGFLRP